MKNPTILLAASVVSVLILLPASSQAIVITPTSNGGELVNALLGIGGTGMNVTSVTVSQNGGCGVGDPCQAGTFTNVAGTYGVGDGIVISSGDVADYGTGPNPGPYPGTPYDELASAGQDLLLDPITGVLEHWDVVQIDIEFDMESGFDTVLFNVVFGSEEDPELDPGFVDGFGMFLNGTNIALVGLLPVNVEHPGFFQLPGTELDRVLAPGMNPVLSFSGGVDATGNVLTFILSDAGDDAEYDSTAYISALSGTTPPPPTVPEPSTVALLAAGLWALHRRQRRS